MPEVIPSLPSGKRKPRSPHAAIFEKVKDGQTWLIRRAEYSGAPESFRNSLCNWMRVRKFKAQTTVGLNGDVAVKVIEDTENRFQE